MYAKLITGTCLFLAIFLFSSCKKDTKVVTTSPPLTAAILSIGKAGIQLTTTEIFHSSKSFDQVNTANTSAFARPANSFPTLTSITLEAIEMKNNFLFRKVTISIIVPKTLIIRNDTISIDLADHQSFTQPEAWVRMEGYKDYLGSTYWEVKTGTLMITKLTSTEIEGNFTGKAMLTSNSPLRNPFSISKGLFAGRY